MNIAWGDVRAAIDAQHIESVKTRGTITQVDDRAGGVRPTTQSPYHFSESRAEVRGGAPHLGEHNQQVLEEWLGLTGAEAAACDSVLVQQLPE